MHGNHPDLLWLNQYVVDEPRHDLSRIFALLELVNRPHLAKPVIHIAGTNGKGSTIAHLKQLLINHGQQVGIFSTPYMMHYEDQIVINDQPIDREELHQYFAKYYQLFEDHSTYPGIQGITEFELITVIAYDYFAHSDVDYVIMETGFGGTLDSTNVCQPMITGITTIGLDHTSILGDTLEEIAAQKAGIIKESVPVVLGNIPSSASQVIRERANELSAPVIEYQRNYHTDFYCFSEEGYVEFIYDSPLLEPQLFKTPLSGKHQADNAGMAIQLFEQLAHLENWSYDPQSIQRSLDETQMAGRMETVLTQPTIVLDGAHNPQAIERLVDNMTESFHGSPIRILFSAINTKDIRSMVEALHLIPHQEFALTTFHHDNAFSIDDLKELSLEGDSVIADWQSYLSEYIEKNHSEDVLLITGSLYFISQVRLYLMNRNDNPLGESFN